MTTTTQPTTALRERVSQAPVGAEEGPTPEQTLKAEIKRMEQAWANALPKTVTPDRFVRTVLTEVSKNPVLAECTTVTVLGAVTQAAQLGLEFGPLGLAYLVPFWNGQKRVRECQLIVGYRGYLQLARRSGEVKDIKAVAVHENDRQFDFWEDENGTHLIHRPAFDDRGAVVRYYGRCTFTNGGSLVMLVSLEEIEKRKARSQSADKGFSPWKSDPEAMRLKSTIRAMIPWLPLATEVAQGLASDEQVIRLSGSNLVVDQAPAIEAAVSVAAQDASGEPEAPAAQGMPPRSPEETELLEELDLQLDSLPAADAKAVQSLLVQKFDPQLMPTADDIRWAIAIVVNWEQDHGETPNPAGEASQDAPGAPEGPESAEPQPQPDAAEDGDPGPTEPGYGPSTPTVQADPKLERRIQAALEAMPATRIDEISRMVGVPVKGQLPARKLRLLPILVAGHQNGDQAIIDLF